MIIISNNLEFCISEVKKRDYYRYLCCLLCPENLRNNLFVIYAFNCEISRIKYAITEPMAGHIRLQWWRDAIDEIYEGEPVKHRHEVTYALYQLISQIDIPKEMFIDLIDAREADIEFEEPENMDNIKNYAIATESNLFKLCLATLQNTDETVKEAAHHAGIAYGITSIMRQMAYDSFCRRVMLPKNKMKKAQLTADDVIEGRKLERTYDIVKRLCDIANVHQNHVKVLQKDLSKNARNILLPTTIVKPFLKTIEKHQYDLFQSDIEKNRLITQISILKGKLLGF